MTDTTPIPFSEFDLRPALVEHLESLGFQHPTEVQTLAIPRILEGSDIVVQSRTGTGKTLAYGIPIIEKVDPKWDRIQALVLTPTRELALQVRNAVSQASAPLGIRVTAIYGGDSMRRQIDELRRPPQIVAATPGRLLDHMGRGTLSLSDCFWVVLDEADEMLSMGFYEEVERILREVPRDRQTLLFSATIPQTVLSVAHNYLDKPKRVSLSDDYISVREIAHEFVLTTEMEKERELARLLEYEDPDACIVFCNTRDEARKVANYLKSHRFGADLISGELTQRERERVMRRIKAGHLQIMVATDVAARGIDVVGMPLVICYSTSESPEVYIHRSGRTGRVGKPGRCVSLVSGRDLHSFNRTEKANGLKIQEIAVPTIEAVKERRSNRMWEKLEAYSQEHEFDESDEFGQLVPRILEAGKDDPAILYALLKHFFEERKFREAVEPIALEAPEEAADDGTAVEHEPREDGGRKRSRRRKRGRDRDESRGEAREPRREGRGDSSSDERRSRRERSGTDSFVVVAVGSKHGVEPDELRRMAGRRARRGDPITVQVGEDHSVLTMPSRSTLGVLEGLSHQRIRGQLLLPLQILGDTPPKVEAPPSE